LEGGEKRGWNQKAGNNTSVRKQLSGQVANEARPRNLTQVGGGSPG